jgi:ribosome-binding ATPase YchF (GTP1/OBG family)
VILNSDDSRFGKSQSLLVELGTGRTVVEFAGTFEMELAALASHEAKAFMEDMGISQSARDRLTQTAYRMLGLLSFFTVGEDEVRAWTVRQGATAVEAAAVIHTDLARGFIRAECFSYEDLTGCGSEKAVKEKGLLRLEGKEYEVKDGDVLSFRFNV